MKRGERPRKKSGITADKPASTLRICDLLVTIRYRTSLREYAYP